MVPILKCVPPPPPLINPWTPSQTARCGLCHCRCPADSCLDIHYTRPTAPDGNYWISVDGPSVMAFS